MTARKPKDRFQTPSIASQRFPAQKRNRQGQDQAQAQRVVRKDTPRPVGIFFLTRTQTWYWVWFVIWPPM